MDRSKRLPPSPLVLAAIAAFLSLATGATAAPELVPDPYFRQSKPAPELALPVLYQPRLDDAGLTDATFVLQRSGLEHHGRQNRLIISPARTGATVRFMSPPLLVSPGHVYLLSIGWDRRRGPAEAALVAHTGTGEILAAESTRIVMLPDGHAYSANLVLGDPKGSFLFGQARDSAAIGRPRSAIVEDQEGLSVAVVRIGPIRQQVAYLDLHLSHGRNGVPAVFWMASLVDLSDGVTAVLSRGLSPPIVVAPDGAVLDPRRPPSLLNTQSRLEVDASAGESVALGLLLPSADDSATMSASDLTRVDQADELSRTSRGAKIDSQRITLDRLLAGSVSLVDTVFPQDVSLAEPSWGQLQIDIPRATPAGLYIGTVALKSLRSARQEFTIGVRVHVANVVGNLVSNGGFERHRDGLALDWEALGPSTPSTDGDPFTGGHSLLLTHTTGQEHTQSVRSAPCVPTRTARHALELFVRREGEPAPFEVAIVDVGNLQIEPMTAPPHVVYQVKRVQGLASVELGSEQRGWLRIRAVADLTTVENTQIVVTSWPSPTQGASALRLDDVSLTPLLTGLEEISRFERLTSNPGFEIERLGTPRQPSNWTVAAVEASADDSVVPRGDLMVDAPVATGRLALSLEHLGGGIEVRSRVIRISRGDRLVLAFRAHTAAMTLSATALLRVFDRRRSVLPVDIGVRLTGATGGLQPELLGPTAVRIDARDDRNFQTIELRILDLPPEAEYACLAFQSPNALPGFVIDDARVVPVRPTFTVSGLNLDGFARRYQIRLWEDDTDSLFSPVFAQLARLGVKPDVPTPESFVDFVKPFPSVAPPLTSLATAERYATWAHWWWRRGFPVGSLAPSGDEDAQQLLTDLYAVWMAPLRQLGLASLVWTPTPMPTPCPANPRDLLTLDRWSTTLATVAPDLLRAGRPCDTVDLVSREQLAGRLTTWVTPLAELRREGVGPAALLKLREHGDAVWADISPWLDRLDDSPTAPRAATWRAWHFGFDGVVADGMTGWEQAGIGQRLDGAFSASPGLDAAPGVLLWPGPDRQLYLSTRLLQLARGVDDIRLLRRLEELTGEAHGYLFDIDDADLTAAMSAGVEALELAHTIAALPPRRIAANDLLQARTVATVALAALETTIQVHRDPRPRQ